VALVKEWRCSVAGKWRHRCSVSGTINGRLLDGREDMLKTAFRSRSGCPQAEPAPHRTRTCPRRQGPRPRIDGRRVRPEPPGSPHSARCVRCGLKKSVAAWSLHRPNLVLGSEDHCGYVFRKARALTSPRKVVQGRGARLLGITPSSDRCVGKFSRQVIDASGRGQHVALDLDEVNFNADVLHRSFVVGGGASGSVDPCPDLVCPVEHQRL